MRRCCIIPAAGRSSRMGAWKPMLPWGDTTMCGAVVNTVLSAGLHPVVVAGYRADELVAAFMGRLDVTVVVNQAWELGMLGSVRAGIEALSLIAAGFDGFFVAPADMPRLPAIAFALEIEEAERHAADGKACAVFAARAERLGHPVWIPAAFVPGLAGRDPDSRLRDYLLGHSWTSAQVDDDGIFADIDTPETYAALNSH
ncbi:MAG TPA: nucleotidyltransferase family protein [bacterium]|nr:nucleotidyltransferase family protein [bacterium]